MMAAAAPFAEAVLGPGKGLRAVVAGYPWCGTQFQSARLSGGAALLVLQGDRDDWVSLQQCQDAVHAMIVGTGKYKSFEQNAAAVEASGAEIVTVAVRRVNISDPKVPMLTEARKSAV